MYEFLDRQNEWGKQVKTDYEVIKMKNAFLVCLDIYIYINYNQCGENTIAFLNNYTI